MKEGIVINSLDELKAFLNEKGIMEIAIRNSNKRFKTFQKVLINNLPKENENQLAEKVIQTINKSNGLNESVHNNLGYIKGLQNFGVILNGLNLCATCVGFYKVFTKLESIGSKINQQLTQINNSIKQQQDLFNEYEYNKMLSDHNDMLDCQIKQHPYAEEKMRDLVDREFNVLKLLIHTLQCDSSVDKETLIFSIFSLLAMFTNSVKIYDEMCFSKYHDVLQENEIWHGSHLMWMGVFDTLSSQWFIEKIQDYGFFETNLSAHGVDIFYHELLDQVNDSREEIINNQKILVACGDMDIFGKYKELSAKEVVDSIKQAYIDAGKELDIPEVDELCNKDMKLAGKI